jgi:ABC-type uncharacterized transport system permease subunit
MTWLWILLAIIGGGMVGGAIGAAWGLLKIDKAQQIASNTAIAVFATTIELTYGEEFLEGIIEECKTMMTDHPDLISQTARRMLANQWLRDKMKELT